MIVKYKFEVERRRHGRKVMEAVPERSPEVTTYAAEADPVAKEPTRPPVSRKARQLALAYYIERAIESGLIKDYAEAARKIGVTRARLTQIMDLLGMTVEEQGQLLTKA